MPNATAGALILNDDNNGEKVLLTKRNIPPFRGHWCLPGGHIESYETALDAVVREVKEETGLELEPSFFGYFDEIYPDIGVHNVVLIFKGRARGDLQFQPGEVSEGRWFSIEEACRLPLAFCHNTVLEKYAEQS
ncbi:MAG: NUDIX domain-containing protein [Chitinivibrionales bacterium]|nr:NUDIX domain-containing protein [Chitinivibrionales bacterium]